MASNNSGQPSRGIKTSSFFTKHLQTSSSAGYQTIQACRERVLKSSVLQPLATNKLKKQQSPLFPQRSNELQRGIPVPYSSHVRVNSPLHSKTTAQIKTSESSPPLPVESASSPVFNIENESPPFEVPQSIQINHHNEQRLMWKAQRAQQRSAHNPNGACNEKGYGHARQTTIYEMPGRFTFENPQISPREQLVKGVVLHEYQTLQAKKGAAEVIASSKVHNVPSFERQYHQMSLDEITPVQNNIEIDEKKNANKFNPRSRSNDQYSQKHDFEEDLRHNGIYNEFKKLEIFNLFIENHKNTTKLSPKNGPNYFVEAGSPSPTGNLAMQPQTQLNLFPFQRRQRSTSPPSKANEVIQDFISSSSPKQLPTDPIKPTLPFTLTQNTNNNRYQQLADAVQLYLNGDYSKILNDSSSNDEENDQQQRENKEDAASLVISKIEENQRNQIEQIYIVDNIQDNGEDGIQQSPVRPLHHERRVTTVEEQQTMEDLEDSDSNSGDRYLYEIQIRESINEGTRSLILAGSSESMPNNVSESDHQVTSFGITVNNPLKQSSIDNRPQSNLSGESSAERKPSINNLDLQKNKQILITEESLSNDSSSMENLSDENEEHQQIAQPIAALISYESASNSYGLFRNSIQNASKQLQPDYYRQGSAANQYSERSSETHDDWMFQTVQFNLQQPQLTFPQKQAFHYSQQDLKSSQNSTKNPQQQSVYSINGLKKQHLHSKVISQTKFVIKNEPPHAFCFNEKKKGITQRQQEDILGQQITNQKQIKIRPPTQSVQLEAQCPKLSIGTRNLPNTQINDKLMKLNLQYSTVPVKMLGDMPPTNQTDISIEESSGEKKPEPIQSLSKVGGKVQPKQNPQPFGQSGHRHRRTQSHGSFDQVFMQAIQVEENNQTPFYSVQVKK